MKLVNSLMKNSANRSCCTDAGGVWKTSKCTKAAGSKDYDSKGYSSCVKAATN